MKRIATEEHFFPPGYMSYLRKRQDYPKLFSDTDEQGKKFEVVVNSPARVGFRARKVHEALTDLDQTRLAAMDESGIDMQVLSLAFPGVELLREPDAAAVARDVNDELAEIVRRHPGRYAGLAAIARNNPAQAAQELERAVTKLGFKGACVNSHFNGEYLDDPKYGVIFEAAQQLNVPVYLHPREPSPGMAKPYQDYPAMSRAMWGFGADAGLHAMRLLCSGVFDRYPGLQIILGHMGEALPFWIWRIDSIWKLEGVTSAKQLPSYYLKNNFYLTVSGNFFEPALLCTCQALGTDRLMFAVDYPYESNARAVQFIEASSLPDKDKAKIYYLNAEKLFRL